MGAPTNAANVKKALANSEPSTHGTNANCRHRPLMSAIGGNTGQHLLALSFTGFVQVFGCRQ